MSAERHHVNGREPQVRAHAYLRHRNEMRLDHRIMNFATRENFGECVADDLAGAQLALRWARRGIAVAAAWHVSLFHLSHSARLRSTRFIRRSVRLNRRRASFD